MNDFQNILEQTDILEHIQRLTNQQPKKIGKFYGVSPCPFDDCSSTKGFRIWPQDGKYHCFKCKRSGNAHNFTREYLGIANWGEVLRKNAEMIGYQLNGNGTVEKKSAEIDMREKIFNTAAEYYNQLLLKSPNAKKVLKTTRKYDETVLTEWQIGFTGSKPDLLKAHLLKAGFAEKDLLASGLLVIRKQYQISDKVLSWFQDRKSEQLAEKQLTALGKFRNKLFKSERFFLSFIEKTLGKVAFQSINRSDLIKVADANNQVSSDYFIPNLFTFPHILGRQVCDFTIKDARKHLKKKGEDIINYRLRTENRLRNILFMNQDALYHDEVFVVEGEHDAIQLSRALGKRNVVATTGMLSEDQLNCLKKYLADKTVYTAFDLDQAGRKYTEMLFNLLFGKSQIRVLDWGAERTDIDEYLRRSSDPEMAVKDLRKSSQDVFRYLINHSVPEIEDLSLQMDFLRPYLEKLADAGDTVINDIALSNIKDRFSNPRVEGAAKKIILKRMREIDTSKDYNLQIIEENGVYYYKSPNGNSKRISNFKIIIDERIFKDDDFIYQCTIIGKNNEQREGALFTSDDRATILAFKRKIKQYGVFSFLGNAEDMDKMWEYIDYHQGGTRSYHVQQAGYLKERDLWLFGNGVIKDHQYFKADENGVSTVESVKYKSEDVKVYGGGVPELNFEDQYTAQLARNVAFNFNDLLNDGYAGLLFFGFLPATLYSDIIVQAVNAFPFVFFYGVKGTGKSECLAQMLRCFGFQGVGELFEPQTEPGYLQAMQQLSNLPFWTNEFNQRTYEKTLKDVMKGVYNRSIAGKGAVPKKGRLQYVINGVNWIDSNVLPVDDAFTSRMITFALFKEPDEVRKRAFQWLNQNTRQLSVVTRQLILERNKDSIYLLKTKIQEIKNRFVDMGFDLRLSLNYAIPCAALHLIHGLQLPDDFWDGIRVLIERNQDYQSAADPMAMFFKRVNYLYPNEGTEQMLAFADKVKDDNGNMREGDFMLLNIGNLHLQVIQDYKKKGGLFPYESGYIRNIIINSPYIVTDRIFKNVFGKRNYFLAIDCQKLPDILKLDIEIIKDAYYCLSPKGKAKNNE